MKIQIITEGAAGDEELQGALRVLIAEYENEGEPRGSFTYDGELVEWAINPDPDPEPEFSEQLGSGYRYRDYPMQGEG